ncbi:cyclic pyranopterin monophosphate synthase MoaC [Croceicoccus sp. F390]|uniref:Cyclic pyranopterin monophosphate synthase MoaC n=1 Tax=Croceicoccus esteveae TaxID=3075597 RepID=A0ABU2ZHH0_9SPHN|nr:cyclic pyranopterin monophosphate synthase MoaC [Croceicoccus sp. F390]MDT0576056.1 cyclic pyranopterin monophosphate synthase MoaC [Croceicoccus sp. F390]
MSGLTHVDAGGRASMVDVGDKLTTARHAEARSVLRRMPTTIEAVTNGTARKGAVISATGVAGVRAAERTADLIPPCHPLALTKFVVRTMIAPDLPGLEIKAEACTNGQTGVEVETLTAVLNVCLTSRDMVEAIDRKMLIGAISIIAREGGTSG